MANTPTDQISPEKFKWRNSLKYLFEHPFKTSLLFIFLFVVSCLLFVWIVRHNAKIPWMNLESSDKVGTSIGGMSTPVVGLITGILLFITLSYQVRSTNYQISLFRDQYERGEADLILSLFNQFQNELQNFHYTFDTRNDWPIDSQTDRRSLKGLEALDMFILNFKDKNAKTLSQEKRESYTGPRTIEDFFQSNAISLLMDSLSMIKNRISTTPLTIANKDFLERKCSSYVVNYLLHSLLTLDAIFKKYPTISTTMKTKIEEFLEQNPHTKKVIEIL